MFHKHLYSDDTINEVRITYVIRALPVIQVISLRAVYLAWWDAGGSQIILGNFLVLQNNLWIGQDLGCMWHDGNYYCFVKSHNTRPGVGVGIVVFFLFSLLLLHKSGEVQCHYLHIQQKKSLQKKKKKKQLTDCLPQIIVAVGCPNIQEKTVRGLRCWAGKERTK